MVSSADAKAMGLPSKQAKQEDFIARMQNPDFRNKESLAGYQKLGNAIGLLKTAFTAAPSVPLYGGWQPHAKFLPAGLNAVKGGNKIALATKVKSQVKPQDSLSAFRRQKAKQERENALMQRDFDKHTKKNEADVRKAKRVSKIENARDEQRKKREAKSLEKRKKISYDQEVRFRDFETKQTTRRAKAADRKAKRAANRVSRKSRRL